MSEWQLQPLGRLADLVMGQSPESAFVHETERGLPFLQGCAEFGARHPSPVFFVDPPQRVAPAGSVLISVRAPVGTLNMADRDYGIGRGLAAVIGRRRSSRYLAFAIERSIEWLHARSQGSTFLAIGSADLRSLPIPVRVSPHVDELAAEQLNGVDAQITHTEALIAKQEQVRAGLMQDLFTRGVDETGRLRPPREEAPELYHETALGCLPKGWEVRPAERMCSAVIDCKNRTPPPAEEGYPVFRTPNVRNGCFIKEDLDWTDKKSYEEWTRRGRPRPGDILFTREAPVGEVCLVPDEYPEGCLGQRMMLYRPSPDQVSPFFLLYALQSRPVQANLKRIAGGSTVGHVRVGDVRTLSVPWCPPSEQQQIASALFQSEALRQIEQKKLKFSRNIRTALLRDLFTPPESLGAEPRIAAE